MSICVLDEGDQRVAGCVMKVSPFQQRNLSLHSVSDKAPKSYALQAH